MKRFLLILFTCLCVGLGFALPWLAAARQDRAAPEDIITYDAPQDLAGTKADLFSRLTLAHSADNILSLVGPSLRHTEEEAKTAIQEALEILAQQGWTIFSPDLWSFYAVEPYLFTSSSETAIFEKQGEMESLEVASSNTAAILWDCRLTTPAGEELALLLDDDLSLVLSFAYSGDAMQSLSQETAMTAASFCKRYYQVDFLTPTQSKDSSWLIPLVNEAGEICYLPLYSAKTELFLNLTP